jgi:hypothetical protein
LIDLAGRLKAIEDSGRDHRNLNEIDQWRASWTSHGGNFFHPRTSNPWDNWTNHSPRTPTPAEGTLIQSNQWTEGDNHSPSSPDPHKGSSEKSTDAPEDKGEAPWYDAWADDRPNPKNKVQPKMIPVDLEPEPSSPPNSDPETPWEHNTSQDRHTLHSIQEEASDVQARHPEQHIEPTTLSTSPLTKDTRTAVQQCQAWVESCGGRPGKPPLSGKTDEAPFDQAWQRSPHPPICNRTGSPWGSPPNPCFCHSWAQWLKDAPPWCWHFHGLDPMP